MQFITLSQWPDTWDRPSKNYFYSEYNKIKGSYSFKWDIQPPSPSWFSKVRIRNSDILLFCFVSPSQFCLRIFQCSLSFYSNIFLKHFYFNWKIKYLFSSLFSSRVHSSEIIFQSSLKHFISVSVERWCRLRGNLLFYFKSRDQWSEPAGVIVLENVTVKVDNTGMDGTFGLLLTFGASQLQHLSSYTESDRDSWRAAIESASHYKMRLHLQTLKDRLAQIQNAQDKPPPDILCNSSVIDPDTPPLLECSLSCDNLLCDALGRSPSTRLLIFVRNSTGGDWTLYANTEIMEVMFALSRL